MPSPKHLLIGPQVHQTQMGHVRKGCLSRPGLPAGVAADGSRIEASHKGWNSLQRAFSSGLPMMNALCHDFVLRRNMRILWQAGSSKRSTFVQSTQGSHHIRLVSHANAVWNLIKSPESAVAPVLRIVDSGERFGLVQSKVAETFDGLWTIKEEENEAGPKLEELVEATADEQDLTVAAARLDGVDDIKPIDLISPLPKRGIFEGQNSPPAALAHCDQVMEADLVVLMGSAGQSVPSEVSIVRPSTI